MVGGSVGLFFLLRRQGGTYEPEVVTGTGLPPDGAGSGAPAENAPPGMQLDPAVLEQLNSISADVGGMARAIGTATGAWEDAAGQTASQLDQIRQSIEDSQMAQYTDTGLGLDASGATIAATLGAPGTRPASKNAVRWGGSTYERGKGSQFIAEQLKPKGINPQRWAKKHQAAAAYLGIPLKSPAAKKAGPAKPAPKPTPRRPAPIKAPPRATAKVQPKPKPKAKPKPRPRGTRRSGI